MDKFKRPNLSIKLVDSDQENICTIFEEKEILYNESWTGLQVMRALIDIALSNSKPRTVTPPELLEKIKALETENGALKETLESAEQTINSLNEAGQQLAQQAPPATAIVLNYEDKDRQKIIDLFDYCKHKEGMQSFEEMFSTMLNVLQRGGFFLLTPEDYQFLEAKRNENK